MGDSFNFPPWVAISDTKHLKILGKFGEELAELQKAVMRCIIQGINEIDPESGKTNRQALEEELADVSALTQVVEDEFDLRILWERMETKRERQYMWMDGLSVEGNEDV